MKVNFAKIWFWFSSFVVVFVYGLVVGRYQVFPFRPLKAGMDSVTDVFKEKDTLAGTKPTHFLSKGIHPGTGVTKFDKEQTAPGLTFITGFFDGNNEMRLIRPNGDVVRRWPVRFTAIFKDTSFIKTDYFVPKTDWNVEIHGAAALPDGSVVFNFERSGLVKLDRCGVMQWKLSRMTHHVVEPAEDGGFWVGGVNFIERDDEHRFPALKPPYYEDALIKVSPTGEIEQEISFLGLFFRNNLEAGILYANGIPGIELARSRNKVQEEITHLNDIEELSTKLAPRFPRFAAGDLVLSERDYNLIMVIDPKTQKVKWHQRGPWISQHDPDFQPNGRISIFNNNSDGTPGGSLRGGSSVLEVDPVDGSVYRRYGGTSTERMYTTARGKHQYLENGNVLITETEQGRIFEVNSKGEIVWEFITRYDDDEVLTVTQGTRYPESYFKVSDWTACPGS